MPVFYIDSLDIDPGEFLDNCGRGEREELIDLLVKDGYVLLPEGNLIGSQLENEHMDQCVVLGKKFYAMSDEDLKTIESIYTKYK
jgi:hypothetical protein